MVGLRSAGSRLRPVAGTPVSVRAPVGLGGVPGVRAAAGRLCALRRQGGARAVGRGQEPADDALSLVSGVGGQTLAVAAGGEPSPDPLPHPPPPTHSAPRFW